MYADKEITEELKVEYLPPRRHKVQLCPNYEVLLQKLPNGVIPKYYESDPKFLSANSFENVILASYPRSGNTLLRKYLES